MSERPADSPLNGDHEEVDTLALMAQIRARMRQQYKDLGLENVAFPRNDVTNCPAEPEDIPHDANLYHHLQLANELYAQSDPEPALPPSPLSRLPVIGRVWQRLRPGVHVLILFYVNRSIAHQIAVNRHLVSVVNQLTQQSEAQQRAILALQAELQALREPKGH